jgi:hypothetical protein
VNAGRTRETQSTAPGVLRGAAPEPLPYGTRALPALRWTPITLDHVWLAGTMTYGFVVGVVLPAEQSDYWWTVKLGETLWASGQLRAADPLAFTSSQQPYVEQQWLAQLVLAAVHQLGGLEGALLLRGALLALVMGMLFYASRRAGATAAAATMAASVASLSVVGGAAIRAQLLAIPLFLVYLLGTTAWRERPWTLVVLPVAMIVWVNVHGSFVLGLLLVLVAVLGRAWTVGGAQSAFLLPATAADSLIRRFALLGAFCSAAVLVNPYGLGLVPWLVGFLGTHLNGAEGVYATEWAPTSLATSHGAIFFAGAFVLLVLLFRVGLPTPAASLRLVVFAALALAAVRNTLWWALVMTPILAWALTQAFRAGQDALAQGAQGQFFPAAALATEPPRQGIVAVNLLLLVGFVAVAALSLPGFRSRDLLFAADRWPIHGALPSAAADFLAGTPATRIYQPLDWGGYLAWRLAPRQRIFADGRFALYPADVYQDYFRIAEARPGWADRLAARGVDAVVLDRASMPDLLGALATHPDWRLGHCDPVAAVYVPRSPDAPPLAACADTN